MYLSGLTLKELRKLTKLVKRKELLEVKEAQRVAKHGEKMALLDAQMEGLGVGKKRGRPKRLRATATRRPSQPLKSKILTALKTAPPAGLTVRELAQSLGLKPNNVHAWFYTTGKKVPGLKRSADGHYTLAAE